MQKLILGSILLFAMNAYPATQNASFQSVIDNELGSNYSAFKKNLAANPAMQKSAKQAKLSEDEVIAILAYTYSVYQPLNTALRSGGKAAEAVKPFTTVFNSALRKLPNYQGPVHRGVTLPDFALMQHMKGNTVTYEGFTSSAVGRPFPGDQQFDIVSRHGKLITPFSSHPNLPEVIFPPGSKFLVMDAPEHLTKPGKFKMKEVQ